MALDRNNIFVRIFEKFPESTDSWSCKWFWAILLSSIAVFVAALIVLPGAAPTIALVVSTATAFYVLGMRRKGNQPGGTC